MIPAQRPSLVPAGGMPVPPNPGHLSELRPPESAVSCVQDRRRRTKQPHGRRSATRVEVPRRWQTEVVMFAVKHVTDEKGNVLIQDPPIAQFFFQNTKASVIWLAVR